MTLHLRLLAAEGAVTARLGRRDATPPGRLRWRRARNCSRRRRFQATTPRSTPPAARSTPISTCRATTPTFRHCRLTYDSVAANPQPMITFENTIACRGAQQGERPVDVRRRYAAHHLVLRHVDRLIDFNKGDVQQIALQATNATSPQHRALQLLGPGGRHRDDQRQHLQRRHHCSITRATPSAPAGRSRAGADHLRDRRRDPRPGR